MALVKILIQKYAANRRANPDLGLLDVLYFVTRQPMRSPRDIKTVCPESRSFFGKPQATLSVAGERIGCRLG